jgi:hypothetical protein
MPLRVAAVAVVSVMAVMAVMAVVTVLAVITVRGTGRAVAIAVDLAGVARGGGRSKRDAAERGRRQ